MTLPPVIGMVHLGPLPGAPGAGSIDATVDAALRDAADLEAAGYDGVMIENFGDAPFYADDVPKTTVAAMTRVVTQVVESVSIPVGVNVLRNDALAALAVAAAARASFIRVNVLTGTMFTDQGIIEGRAADVARARVSLPGVRILADCFVKHAVPPPGRTFEDELADLWGRAGADGAIISGSGTGSAPDPDRLGVARSVLGPHAPIYVGSGLDADNAAALLEHADGAIVGSSLKTAGVFSPVDPVKARAVLQAARAALS